MKVERGDDLSGPSTVTDHCRPTLTRETFHVSPGGRAPIPARTAVSTASFSSLEPPAQRIFSDIASAYAPPERGGRAQGSVELAKPALPRSRWNT